MSLRMNYSVIDSLIWERVRERTCRGERENEGERDRARERERVCARER